MTDIPNKTEPNQNMNTTIDVLNTHYDSTKVINNWEDISLPDDLLRGIYSIGFERPSSIQQKAIYPIYCGRDVIAQAQSGTGKTGSFTIGALSRLKPGVSGVQILTLAPTHELARQIASVYEAIGQHIPGFSVRTFVGGTRVREDIQILDNNPPTVAVGCPGRVYDLMRQMAFKTDKITTFVIDEADEMLSQGFQEQVRNIFSLLPEDVQVAIFSATMNDEVLDITRRFMRDPVSIVMEREKLSLEGISQYYVGVHNDADKYDLLKHLLSKLNITQCIIYCNSVNRVNQLTQQMGYDGYSVCCMHRDMNKVEREESFREFKQGGCKFLVSSNITARGIDVQQVSLVINYDITRDMHTYLHRIGRSGRWGRKGTAINFLTRYDMPIKYDLERYYRMQIRVLPEDFAG